MADTVQQIRSRTCSQCGQPADEIGPVAEYGENDAISFSSGLQTPVDCPAPGATLQQRG